MASASGTPSWVDDLVAQVQANEDAEDSAAVVIEGIADQISTAVAAASGLSKADAARLQGLAAAIVAETPAAPAPDESGNGGAADDTRAARRHPAANKFAEGAVGKKAAERSKFDQFIHDFGVKQLAQRLGVDRSAIYCWLKGSTSPHPANAIRIQKLAKSRFGVALSLDEIYLHFRQVHSKRYTPRKLKLQPVARV